MHFFRWVTHGGSSKKRLATTVGSAAASGARRNGSSRNLKATPPATTPPSALLNGDVPNVIYVGDACHEVSMRFRTESGASLVSSRRIHDDEESEGDRQFLEEFHRLRGHSTSPRGSQVVTQAISRVSSMFQPRRSTIMHRGSIAELFDHLQFELDSMLDDDQSNATGWRQHVRQSSKDRTSREPSAMRKKKKSKRSNTSSRDDVEAIKRDQQQNLLCSHCQEEQARATISSAPPRPRLWRRMSKKHVSKALTTQSLRRTGNLVVASPRDMSADRDPRCSCPHLTSTRSLRSIGLDGIEVGKSPEPMEFLFFGGSPDDCSIRELDAERRRYRTRVCARLPTPSVATSIRIKSTLVRDLPPLFEPKFETCALMGV